MNLKGLKMTATASGAPHQGASKVLCWSRLLQEWTSLVQRKTPLFDRQVHFNSIISTTMLLMSNFQLMSALSFYIDIVSFSPQTAKQESGKVYQSTPTTDNQDIFRHDWRILEWWTSNLFPVGTLQNELYVPLIVLNSLSFLIVVHQTSFWFF